MPSCRLSLLAIILVSLVGCGADRPAPVAVVTPPPAKVWIELARKVEKGTNYWYGWVYQDELDWLTTHERPPFAFRLHDSYWFDDHGIQMCEDQRDQGIYYLRIENLQGITVMRDRDIAALRREAQGAEAKRKAAREKKDQGTEVP